MPRSRPVDDFELIYDRAGSGPGAILLHGWPGDRGDYRDVIPLLSDFADVVVPDLRGFGESDKHPMAAAEGYSADAQAHSVARLIDELGLGPAVIAGYDVGSRVAQTVARAFPDRVRALVLSPPVPGAGDRVLTPEAQREFWYQAFHQLSLVEELIDGRVDAVRAYLAHFWSHWSGPSFDQEDAELDRLAGVYGAPGAFTASIAWYRAGSGTVATSLRELAGGAPDPIAVPSTVLWPEHDPLFPRDWGDRLGEFFAEVTITTLPGVGHFVPREAASELAGAVRAALARA
ncbi:MAG TPA: alpha/beta hydrolase [Solirubrobacteraceae bacterium]|nr:alpha/beta hydrolase [Solirubrobacteraceae bacterium]